MMRWKRFRTKILELELKYKTQIRRDRDSRFERDANAMQCKIRDSTFF